MNVRFCWSANTGVTMGSIPLENVANEFVLISLVVLCMSCSFFFDGLRDRRLVAAQL